MDKPIRRLTYGEEVVRINQDADNENLQRLKRLSADLIDALMDLAKTTDKQVSLNLIHMSIRDIKDIAERYRHME